MKRALSQSGRSLFGRGVILVLVAIAATIYSRHSPASMLASMQNPQSDYSTFKHNSNRHATLACASCHQRSGNSATPRLPGHKACTECHLAQFVTPNVAMCSLCHSDVNSSNPPLKSFPAKFNETFNLKFDHAQHMNGSARPASGCNACHTRST